MKINDEELEEVLAQWRDEDYERRHEIISPLSIVRIGQRLHCALHGGADGTIYAIEGQQSPGTVTTISGGAMVAGGSAYFSIVWDDGNISQRVPEAVARGVQWHFYRDVADPYTIAERLDAAAALQARKDIETAEAKAAREIEAQRVREEWTKAGLKPVPEGQYAAAKYGAANLRRELRKAFPGVKFSVRSSTYAGGDSIDIRWDLGPSSDEVERISSKYEEGEFDPTTDSYYSNNSVFCQIFGGAKYVQTHRNIERPEFEALVRSYCELRGIEYTDTGALRDSCGRFVSHIVADIYRSQSIPAGKTPVGIVYQSGEYRIVTD